ncbi:putative short-chain dehydrogenase [Massarina eburnea CBS 473.64]|uniref:Putative short-chain dehydrogenase n=1 Tax=Massarina eburnea CBS 473.64 TaxID=1395130 RepID=A0A6A6RHU7_9PLEO|nr:putative short-chain dehydrogenase [Massarina eburnea CBS 473.64]
MSKIPQPTTTQLDKPEPKFHYWRTLLWSQWCFTPPLPTQSWIGKTVIVTGANIGLGKEAARHFASLGAEKVIIAARNLSAAEKAKKDIEQSIGCKTSVIECWSLDLCSYDSVRQFAERCQALERIDCLLENAGVSKYFFYEVEGATDELQITVNVINTFLLALLLFPKLRETAERFKTTPHLTVVTSELHHQTIIPERKAVKEGKHTNLLDALNDKKVASRGGRYPVSKLMQLLCVRELVATLKAKGDTSGVVVNCVNPGFCHSSLTRDFAPIAYIGKILMRARSTEVGSRTLVHAASAGMESQGEYLSNCQVARVADWVKTEEGREWQGRVWEEVLGRLEGISPGVSGNIHVS